MDRDSKIFVNEIARRGVLLWRKRIQENQDPLFISNNIFNSKKPYTSLLNLLKNDSMETIFKYKNHIYLLSNLDIDKHVNFSKIWKYVDEGEDEEVIFKIKHILERITAGFGTAIDFLIYLYLIKKKYSLDFDIKKLALRAANSDILNIPKIAKFLGFDYNTKIPFKNSFFILGNEFPKFLKDSNTGCPILLDKTGILDFLIELLDLYYDKNIQPYLSKLNLSYFEEEEIWIFLKED